MLKIFQLPSTLRHVNLMGCEGCTSRGFVALAQRCPDLTTLAISIMVHSLNIQTVLDRIRSLPVTNLALILYSPIYDYHCQAWGDVDPDRPEMDTWLLPGLPPTLEHIILGSTKSDSDAGFLFFPMESNRLDLLDTQALLPPNLKSLRYHSGYEEVILTPNFIRSLPASMQVLELGETLQHEQSVTAVIETVAPALQELVIFRPYYSQSRDTVINACTNLKALTLTDERDGFLPFLSDNDVLLPVSLLTTSLTRLRIHHVPFALDFHRITALPTSLQELSVWDRTVYDTGILHSPDYSTTGR